MAIVPRNQWKRGQEPFVPDLAWKFQRSFYQTWATSVALHGRNSLTNVHPTLHFIGYFGEEPRKGSSRRVPQLPQEHKGNPRGYAPSGASGTQRSTAEKGADFSKSPLSKTPLSWFQISQKSGRRGWKTQEWRRHTTRPLPKNVLGHPHLPL